MLELNEINVIIKNKYKQLIDFIKIHLLWILTFLLLWQPDCWFCLIIVHYIQVFRVWHFLHEFKKKNVSQSL